MRAILAVLALLPLAASAVPLQPPVCAETGTHDVVWGNGTVPVVSCRAFYAQGMRPAIKLPDDTASVVYGALEQRTMPVDGPGAVFWTRANKTYTVKAGVIPAAANPKDFSQIVYKAHVGKNGIVNHVEPAVFIDKEAVIRPFANTFFAGTVTNM